jgi:hypothetical protein
MIDYYRLRRGGPRPLVDDEPGPAACGGGSWDLELDRQFLESWRDQLMAYAWSALEKVQERSGQPFADVLRLRVAHPELKSSQLAEELSGRLCRAVNAGWVRLNLHRARDMFVESGVGIVG